MRALRIYRLKLEDCIINFYSLETRDMAEGVAVAQWLGYTICAQRVVGSNPRKVNGGGRKGIRP